MKKTRGYYSSRSLPGGEDCQEKDMEAYKKMKEDLDAYNERGVMLRLSGRKASSARIANACCIRECGSYMCDYILDEEGRLVEISFDKVKKY